MLSFRLILLFVLAIAAPGTPTPDRGTPAAFSCPVTEPTSERPDVDPFQPDASLHHENGLWVTIPEDGIITLTPEDVIQIGPATGWRSIEVMWLRDEGVEGFVEVTGTRLDKEFDESPRTPLSPQRQYVRVGTVLTGIAFPDKGCWEVTGTVDDRSITWVVDVRFVETIASPTP